MSVVFGWYSFKIKSYDAKDLDLNDQKWDNSKFEVRQKVFHLFWLPVFSLGKLYEVRTDGKRYQLSNSIAMLLKAKKVRTPWYAFFLPIILIVGLLGTAIFIPIAESYMRYENYSYEQEQYDASMQKVEAAMKNLKPNSYLRIVHLKSPDRDSATFLKLIEKKETIYNFQIYKTAIPHESRDVYKWKKTSKDTITISKSDLNKAICMDYDIYNKRTVGFNFFGDSRNYIVDQIEYFDEPVIDGKADWNFWDPVRRRKFNYYNILFKGHKNNRSWSFKLPIQNFGIPVDLVEIQNIESNVQWSNQLPVHFESYVYLKKVYIVGNTTIDPDTLKFTSKFIFQDSLKNKYEYIIKGDKAWFTVDRATNKTNK